jgi:alpha-tubulin suppressor-like RCC1 family protein
MTHCLLTAAGAAYCWGHSGLGSDIGYSEVPVPVDTSGVLSGKRLVDVATSVSHSCAVDSDGAAYCWGRDGDGALGNGRAGGGTTPVMVDAAGVLAGKNLIDVQVGDEHSCALADDGGAFCWGSNRYGALGASSDRERAHRPVPVDLSAIPDGETLVSLVTNPNYTTCALSDAGRAYCWGLSDQGQTGTGLVQRKVARPERVVASGVLHGVALTSLAATWTSFCGLGDDDRVYCWGNGATGALGNGYFKDSAVPVAVKDGVLDGAVVTQIGSGGEIWLVMEAASP